jgi:hypothetical protein
MLEGESETEIKQIAEDMEAFLKDKLSRMEEDL